MVSPYQRFLASRVFQPGTGPVQTPNVSSPYVANAPVGPPVQVTPLPNPPLPPVALPPAVYAGGGSGVVANDIMGQYGPVVVGPAYRPPQGVPMSPLPPPPMPVVGGMGGFNPRGPVGAPISQDPYFQSVVQAGGSTLPEAFQQTIAHRQFMADQAAQAAAQAQVQAAGSPGLDPIGAAIASGVQTAQGPAGQIANDLNTAMDYPREKTEAAAAAAAYGEITLLRKAGYADATIVDMMLVPGAPTPWDLILPKSLQTASADDKAKFIAGFVDAYEHGYTAYGGVPPLGAGGPGAAQMPVVGHWGPGPTAAHEYVAGQMPWWQRAANDVALDPVNYALPAAGAVGESLVEQGTRLAAEGAAEEGTAAAAKTAAGRVLQGTGYVAQAPNAVLNTVADEGLNTVGSALKDTIAGAPSIFALRGAEESRNLGGIGTRAEDIINYTTRTPTNIQAKAAGQDALDSARIADQIEADATSGGTDIGGTEPPVAPPEPPTNGQTPPTNGQVYGKGEQSGNGVRMQVPIQRKFGVRDADGTLHVFDTAEEAQTYAGVKPNAPEGPVIEPLDITQVPEVAPPGARQEVPHQNGQSIFDPTADVRRLVDLPAAAERSGNDDLATKARAFEQANGPKRAVAAQQDRDLETAIKQKQREAESLKAQRDQQTGAERKATQAAIDQTYAEADALKVDQKINGVEHTVYDVANDYQNHFGGLPDIPITASRLDLRPDRTAIEALVDGGRTPEGNPIKAAKDPLNARIDPATGNEIVPNKYTIQGRGPERAIITKDENNMWTVRTNKAAGGKTVGTGLTDREAAAAADRVLTPAAANFTDEPTEYLIERAVYQDDQDALNVLRGRVSETPARRIQGEPFRASVTPDQFNRIEIARGNLRSIRETKPPSWPSVVQRIEEPGVAPGTVDKPQGLYTSPAGAVSPHADLGGHPTLLRTNPNANVLEVEAGTIASNRGRFVGEPAGIAALRQLEGDDVVAQLLSMSKEDALTRARQDFPRVDWDRYGKSADTHDIVDAYGSLRARQQGYDAIWSVDKADHAFDEYVGLTDRAFSENAPPPPGTEGSPEYPGPNERAQLRGEEPTVPRMDHLLPPDVAATMNEPFLGQAEPLYKGKPFRHVRDAIHGGVVADQAQAQRLAQEIAANKQTLGLDPNEPLLRPTRRGVTRPVVRVGDLTSDQVIAQEKELAALQAKHARSGDILAGDARDIANRAAAYQKELDLNPNLAKRPHLALDLLNALAFRSQRHLALLFPSYGERNVIGNLISSTIGTGGDNADMILRHFGDALRQETPYADRFAADWGLPTPSRYQEATNTLDVTGVGADTPARELSRKLRVTEPVAKGFDATKRFYRRFEIAAKIDLGYLPIARAQAQEGMATLADELTSYLGKRGVEATRDGVRDAIWAVRKEETGVFAAADLRPEMRQFALDHGMDEAAADRFAQTAGDRWTRLSREAQNEATAQTERIFPSQRRMTNLDRLAGYVFFFHMWPTRMARFALEEMVRRPQIYHLWREANRGLNRMAEEGNYPMSARMLMKIADSPFGFALFMNPSSLWLVSQLQPDTQTAQDPEHMTKFGHFLKEVKNTTGLGTAPFIDAALNVLGVYGNAFPPAPWPGTMFDLAGAAVDDALIRMGQGPGTPIYKNAMVQLRAMASGILPGTSNIPATDQSAYTVDIVGSVVLDNDPALAQRMAQVGPDGKPTADALAAKAEYAAIMDNPDDPRYVAAEKQAADQNLFTRVFNALSPFSLKAKLLSRERTLDASHAGTAATNAGGEMTPLEQGAKQVRDAVTQTPEANQLDAELGEYHLLGTERQQQLGDGWALIAFVGFDPATQTVTIGGRAYTAAELNAMTPQERYALADAWVAEVGGTQELATYRDQQDTFKAAHPMLKGYDDYKAQISKSPLGEDGWIAVTRQGNPSFDAYLTEQQQKYGTLPRDAAFTPGGYFAYQGKQHSIYDPNPPSVRDMSAVPFNANETVGGIGQATSSGSGNSVQARADRLAQSVAVYTAKIAAIQPYLPQNTSWDSLSPNERAAYTASLARQGLSIPGMPSTVANYYAWKNTRPVGADTSYAAYFSWMDEMDAKLGLPAGTDVGAQADSTIGGGTTGLPSYAYQPIGGFYASTPGYAQPLGR